MYIIKYPQIEGSEGIHGWTWRDRTVVNLNPGETYESENMELVNDLQSTYRFLELVREEEPVSKKAQKQAEISLAEDHGFPTEFPALRALAKERGVYSPSMGRKQIIEALIALETDTNKESEE